MDYVITQADAARELGISPQALGRALKSSGNTALRGAEKGVLASSLLEEIARRYQIVACALQAKEGECLCCRQPLGSNEKDYLPGHDSILRGALLTTYGSGSSTEKMLVEAVLQEQGKTLTEFFKIMNVSHLIDVTSQLTKVQ